MRPDMGKCVIEAPRRGSSNLSAKAARFGKITLDEEGYDYEGLTRLPSSKKQRSFNMKLGDKDFSDKLGPLHNFLINSCGQPWDHVYSEIAYHIGRMHSPGISHIKEAHIHVETHTFRDGEGAVWGCNKYGVHRVTSHYRSQGGFYVEPETGLLRRAKYIPRFIYPKRIPGRDDPNAIPLSANEEHRKINGIWYYQRFERAVLRAVQGRTISGNFIRYGEEIITTVLRKRQLGKADLKRFGLKNGMPPAPPDEKERFRAFMRLHEI